MIKNTIFDNRISIEIKTTTTAVIKNELKYLSISEGNTSIAEPNLDSVKDWFSFFLLKV